MAEGNANFRRLLDLAKEQSSEKRRELLRDVTDLFLESPAEYSETEREHFGVIMGRVAQDMETAIRRHLATQLAEVGEAPHALIQQLANDEISVAAEVIAKSTVLHEADLVALAKIQGQEHLAAIATRPVVPTSVSDVLVERGNDNVLVKLVNNTGATISRGAMEKVVERSESVAALHAPLIGRKDLPVDLLQDMFSFVSTELRTKITQKMEGMPPDVLEKALAATQSRFRQEVKHIKDADRRAMIFVNDKERSKELTESLLVQLVRSGQELEFSHAFARLGGIDVKTAQRIVKTKNVEGVAIVSKAARFDRSTFTAIALLLIGRESDVKSTQEILELYDQVTAEAAQRVMRFWKVRKEASETPAATASPSTLSHAASA